MTGHGRRRARGDEVLRGYRIKAVGPHLAGGRRAGRCPGPAAQDRRSRGRRTGQRVLPRPVRAHRQRTARAHRPRAHRPGARRDPPGAREPEFRDAQAALALLLANDGAGRGHRRTQRGRHAQRSANARQLRPAVGPGRARRAARAGHHVLLDRQRARSVLLPAIPADGGGQPSRHRAWTSPTKTLSALTSTPSGWPRPA